MLKRFIGRTNAFKLVAVQALLALLYALILWIFAGFSAAYSALLGGLVCVCANLVFVVSAFNYSGARAAKKIMRSFYIGEALKIIVTAGLFIIIFNWGKISFLPLISGYIIALAGFWFAPLVFRI